MFLLDFPVIILGRRNDWWSIFQLRAALPILSPALSAYFDINKRLHTLTNHPAIASSSKIHKSPICHKIQVFISPEGNPILYNTHSAFASFWFRTLLDQFAGF